MSDLKLEKLMEVRHSGRVYDLSLDLPLSALKPLIQAAHWAPSCYNEQPWHFILSHKTETPEAYQKIHDSLAESNRKWSQGVPILVAVVAKNFYRKHGKPNRHGPYDAGSAAFSMALEAAKLGYMAHQMGGFDEKKLAAAFGIPEGYTPMAVMTLGYEKAGEPVPAKDRREIDKHFYYGTWQNDA